MSATAPITEYSLTEQARPFFYKGGRTGVLLIHGFTGTPFIFKELGRRLIGNDYTVLAPLIAGHGTTPEEMESTNWEDWYNSAQKSYTELAKTCDIIYVIGASFGSSIACQLAATHNVAGLVLIGTPLWINKHTLIKVFTPIFMALGIKFYEKSFSKTLGEGVFLGGPTLSYRKIPVRSVGEFLEFNDSVRKNILSKVDCPTLIIQSINDGLVKPISGKVLFEKIGSQEKELVWIDEPHHKLHTGTNKYYIYDLIMNFFSRKRTTS